MESIIKIYEKLPIKVQALKFVYSPAGIEELKSFVGDSLSDYGKDRRMDAIG